MADEKKNVFVTSYNQSGGITAHTVNVGAQPRHFNAETAAQLTQMIQKGKPVNVVAVMGDQEAFQFAAEIKAYLESQGYAVSGVDQAVYLGPVVGQFIYPKDGSYEIRFGSRG